MAQAPLGLFGLVVWGRVAVAHWIEVVYNRRRRHTTIGMVAPCTSRRAPPPGGRPRRPHALRVDTRTWDQATIT